MPVGSYQHDALETINLAFVAFFERSSFDHTLIFWWCLDRGESAQNRHKRDYF